MGTIYTGLGPSWYVPGIYINVELGMAPPSAAAIPRRVLIIGTKTDESASGVADNDLHLVSSIANASDLFGPGSELHLMAQAAFQANPAVELWAYVQAAPSGAKAMTSNFIATAAAASDGTLTVSVLGQTCRVKIAAGDLAVDVAPKVAAAFNSQLENLPYEAERLPPEPDPPDGNFRFVAKVDGEGWNGPEVVLEAGSTGLEFNQTSAALAGGSEEEDLENGAFDADNSPLFTKRFHYVVVPTVSAGSVTALFGFLNAQADSKVGFRQQGLFGTRKDLPTVLSDYKTSPNEIREARVQCIWAKNNAYFPGQLSAAAASVRCLWESTDPAVNLCLRPIPSVPPSVGEDLPTITQKNLALSNGITPLIPDGTEMVFLRSVTMADIYATHPVLDTGKVTVSDFLADDIQIKMRSRYKGFKLAPDSDLPLPAKTTSPSAIKRSLLEWLRESEAAGRITRVTELAEQIKVEIDSDVSGRVNFEIPEDVVDIFAVGAGNIIQIA